MACFSPVSGAVAATLHPARGRTAAFKPRPCPSASRATSHRAASRRGVVMMSTTEEVQKGDMTDEGVFVQMSTAPNPSFEKSEQEKRTMDAQERVRILSEALPNIQRFRGETVVVKYGGAAMKDETLKDLVVKDLVLLWCLGLRPVLVHGGGPEINKWLNKLNIEPNFSPSGLRITDKDTMDIVEMVLVGRVNKSIVALIEKCDGKAVGLCGKDAGLVKADIRDFEALGYVGDVTSVDVTILKTLVDSGVIPVVATVASDKDGNALNINADTVAGEIAAGLGASKLILMTDVPGVMTDKDDISSIISTMTIAETRALIKEEVIYGGMIPKVQCCVAALAQGVRAAHIIDGRQPHSLLTEVMSEQGSGTMIVG